MKRGQGDKSFRERGLARQTTPKNCENAFPVAYHEGIFIFILGCWVESSSSMMPG